MKIKFIIASFFLLTACHNENDKNPIDVKNESFLKKMDSLYKTGYLNGFSATIVDTSGIVYNEGFGYANVEKKKNYTENTIINIASISKVFVGVALMKAKDIGILKLDDPINNYLPFQVVNPNFPDNPITIRHLATHTSSIVDTDIYMKTCYINKDNVALAENLKVRYNLYYQNPSTDWMPLLDYLRSILKQGEPFYTASTFSKNKPGELYEYSNVGAALCALIIESASGKPFNNFTQEHIFKPLNMDVTSWFFEEIDSTNYSKLYYQDQVLPYYKILSYPDGGLITSSTELGLFLAELINGYSGTGTLLSKDSYQEIFKSQLSESNFKNKTNFNVGLFTEKELKYHVIGHNGGDPGTNTMMYFDTEKKTGKILITNTDSDEVMSDTIFWGIWNTLDEFQN